MRRGESPSGYGFEGFVTGIACALEIAREITSYTFLRPSVAQAWWEDVSPAVDTCMHMLRTSKNLGVSPKSGFASHHAPRPIPSQLLFTIVVEEDVWSAPTTHTLGQAVGASVAHGLRPEARRLLASGLA